MAETARAALIGRGAAVVGIDVSADVRRACVARRKRTAAPTARAAPGTTARTTARATPGTTARASPGAGADVGDLIHGHTEASTAITDRLGCIWAVGVILATGHTDPVARLRLGAHIALSASAIRVTFALGKAEASGEDGHARGVVGARALAVDLAAVTAVEQRELGRAHTVDPRAAIIVAATGITDLDLLGTISIVGVASIVAVVVFAVSADLFARADRARADPPLAVDAGSHPRSTDADPFGARRSVVAGAGVIILAGAAATCFVVVIHGAVAVVVQAVAALLLDGEDRALAVAPRRVAARLRARLAQADILRGGWAWVAGSGIAGIAGTANACAPVLPVTRVVAASLSHAALVGTRVGLHGPRLTVPLAGAFPLCPLTGVGAGLMLSATTITLAIPSLARGAVALILALSEGTPSARVVAGSPLGAACSARLLLESRGLTAQNFHRLDDQVDVVEVEVIGGPRNDQHSIGAGRERLPTHLNNVVAILAHRKARLVAVEEGRVQASRIGAMMSGEDEPRGLVDGDGEPVCIGGHAIRGGADGQRGCQGRVVVLLAVVVGGLLEHHVGGLRIVVEARPAARLFSNLGLAIQLEQPDAVGAEGGGAVEPAVDVAHLPLAGADVEDREPDLLVEGEIILPDPHADRVSDHERIVALLHSDPNLTEAANVPHDDAIAEGKLHGGLPMGGLGELKRGEGSGGARKQHKRAGPQPKRPDRPPGPTMHDHLGVALPRFCGQFWRRRALEPVQDAYSWSC